MAFTDTGSRVGIPLRASTELQRGRSTSLDDVETAAAETDNRQEQSNTATDGGGD